MAEDSSRVSRPRAEAGGDLEHVGTGQEQGPATNRVTAPISTITLCKHEAFGTPDFYFTALMIAHHFQKRQPRKRKWSSLGGVQLIWVSGPLIGSVRGSLSAIPLPGCAGLI